jgi:hypothetical protein
MFMHELVHHLNFIYCIHMKGMLHELSGIDAKIRGNGTQQSGWVC